MPQIIIDMLVGSLLGDAFGSIPTGGVNPVFEIKQLTIHSEYLRFRTIANAALMAIFEASIHLL